MRQVTPDKGRLPIFLYVRNEGPATTDGRPDVRGNHYSTTPTAGRLYKLIGMKKTGFFVLFFLFLHYAGTAQLFNPVRWEFSAEQVSADLYDLTCKATIDPGWYIYSQYLESDDGPVRTSFHFEEGAHYALSGTTEERSAHRKELNDPLFDDMLVIKFSDEVSFVQRIRVLEPGKPVKGYLEFMTCDQERCLPPKEVDFAFQLTSSKPVEKTTAGTAPEAAASPSPAPLFGAAGGADLSVTSAENGLLDPVKWELTVEQEQAGTYRLSLTARIEPGWYLYSQHIEPGGPEPTAIELEPAEGLVVAGPAEEISEYQVDGFDEMFGMDIRKYKSSVLFRQKVTVADPSRTIKGQVYFMSCDDSRCLPGVAVPFEVVPATLTATIPAGGEAAATGQADLFSVDKTTAAECGEVAEIQADSGMWGIFVLGFIGGLLALLTPCVFPMIPLTVSFFTKGSQDKKKGIFNAVSYGFYILLVYLLLSIPFHLLDSVSPGILNEISTNIWLNIAFFIIFLVFAFSFFGYYELTLPSSWANKAAAAEGVGGAVGIFFMALTLALVSFSCTGPILGSLLAGALTAEGGAWQLTAGMGGFGLALALPFALFAAFPSWLSNLPKSGGWMTTVKVVLGFLELALALKFLSNADLVKHWGLLKIEVFLGLWIVVFLAMGLYLFGKILFPHDSPHAKLSAGRKLTGVLSFAFAVYLMTGFRHDAATGSFQPLKLLSGLAPPVGYSWLYPKDCPQNLDCFKDFEQGLAYARSVNKPIMIDFTGHACVNCRKMEEHVWPEQAVYGFLKDEYVLISLYVDEKIELPAEEQKVLPMKTGGTFRLRTTGHKWQYMQTELFDNNSQPYYVLLSPDGRLLAKPVGYTPDANEYAGFLQCGLDRFRSLSSGQ